MTAPEGKPAVRRPRSGVVVPHQAAWHQRLAARAIAGTIRVLAASLRFELHDESGWFEHAPAERLIFAIWHNRLALSLILYDRYLRRQDPSRRMAAMVSASRDGGLLARILELFAVQPVRGSTSRRGPQALRELTTWAERGYDLAITPDGPRGPPYVVQEGVISLAQLTGLPVVPVSFRLSRKRQFQTWDRFQVPLPLARCDIYVGPPLRVSRETSDAQRELLRQELETTLRRLTHDG